MSAGQQRWNAAELAESFRLHGAVSPHTVPRLQAAQAGVLSLMWLSRGRPAALGLLPEGHPALVVVPDDDEARTGPAGWSSADRMARWSAGGFIHAEDGTVDSYRAAVVTATNLPRLVLVECGSAHSEPWYRVFADACRPTLVIVPPAGVQHPVPGASRETVH